MRTRRILLAVVFLLPLINPVSVSAQILPTGIRELEMPYRYFLRKSDFIYIYQINNNEKLKQEVSLINEDFLDFIKQKKYKDAEKILVKNFDNPYYLLNLVLLYIYLDQKEYKNLFLTWQESSHSQTIENLIDVFAARKFNLALLQLSVEIKTPSLKRYALYKLYREQNQPDLIQINFSRWKEEIGETAEKPDLYQRAYFNWIFEAAARFEGKSPNQKIIVLDEKDVESFEADIKQKKYTREVFGRYLEFLLEQKHYGRLKKLVGEIIWLTAEERKTILQKTQDMENQNQEKISTEDYIKVKIQK